MKKGLILVFFLFTTADLAAQVIVRNDFRIKGRGNRIENRGLTAISINLDHRPNWNQLINGRGGRTMVIDVLAIRHKERHYTYTEIAERVYTPPVYTGGVVRPVPLFLLLAPKHKGVPFVATFRGLNLDVLPKMK